MASDGSNVIKHVVRSEASESTLLQENFQIGWIKPYVEGLLPMPSPCFSGSYREAGAGELRKVKPGEDKQQELQATVLV